jgi:hypothetical protein
MELLKLDAEGRGSVIRTFLRSQPFRDDEWNHVKTWSIVMILGAAPARGGSRGPSPDPRSNLGTIVLGSEK